MNLSGKVEETLEKLKARPINAGSQSGVMQTEKPKFSVNFEDIRDYLIIIIGFGICAVSVFLLIIPQYKQISVISADFSSAQLEFNEVQKQSRYLESLVGLKEELESKIAIADQVLPSTEDRVPYVLDQLVQIADISNVSIESLNLSGISDAGGVKDGTTIDLRSVLIQLTIKGSDSNAILEFAYNLEKARTIVNVNTMQLALSVSTSKDPDTGVSNEISELKATFGLESYLKPESDSREVDLESLANSPDYDTLFEKLNSMDFYETRPLEVEFGRENPFGVSEATPEVSEITEDDASGIE